MGMERGRLAGYNCPILGPINGIGHFVGYPLWSPDRGRILSVVAAKRGFGGRPWQERGKEAEPLLHIHFSSSLGGFDSAEVLAARSTTADILLGTGRIPEGLKHLRASQFLMEFLAGKNHSGISSTYYRMGSHYHDAGRPEDALRLYGVAATRRSEDRLFDCLIARNSAGVLARLGQFKPAFDYKKKAYQLYATFLGEEHDATKSCSNTLIVSLFLLINEF